jgi:hypothetical protein
LDSASRPKMPICARAEPERTTQQRAHSHQIDRKHTIRPYAPAVPFVPRGGSFGGAAVGAAGGWRRARLCGGRRASRHRVFRPRAGRSSPHIRRRHTSTRAHTHSHRTP